MSLVPLQKVTFAGFATHKADLVDALQRLGCVQIVPLQQATAAAELPASAGARQALRFLEACRPRRRQVRDASRFDAERVEAQIHALRDRLQDLEQERDILVRHLNAFAAWGEFAFPELEELGGRRLWFYAVPHKELAKVATTDRIYEVVRRDSKNCYVVVVAAEEPQDMPVPRIHLGGRSRRSVEDHLEEVELAIEDAEAERASLTRWLSLLRTSLDRLEDRAERLQVAAQTYDRDPLFALQGWAPRERIADLAALAREQDVYCWAEDPGPGDRPPTLLRNRPWLAAGEDLVNFYMTPSYGAFDPSAVVFLSFALFFGMILSDAGYAALLGMLLLVYWRSWGRSESGRRYRSLAVAIVLSSLVWGSLIGSWFGFEPAADSVLGRLHRLDLGDANRMMTLSVVIGCTHLILANLCAAARRPRWQLAVAPVGWAVVVAGGLALAAGGALEQPVLRQLGFGALGLGLLAVLLFEEPFAPPWPRLLAGLKRLTEISRAFGDVLSYLRLFALGMAGAALAAEFNRMAQGVMAAVPGIGLLFGVVLWVLGHALNLVIGCAAALIHGLRLNVIEFFNWALQEEGTLFRPLRRREKA